MLLEDMALSCFVLPCRAAGLRFASYLAAGEGALASADEGALDNIHILHIKDQSMVAVLFPTSLFKKARSYWQHTGEIFGSRRAADLVIYLASFYTWMAVNDTISSITKLGATSLLTRVDANVPSMSLQPASLPLPLPLPRPLLGLEEAVLGRIGRMVYSRQAQDSAITAEFMASHMVLTVCGMAAIFTALRVALAVSTPPSVPHHTTAAAASPTVVIFGFPYLDTLKVSKIRLLLLLLRVIIISLDLAFPNTR